MEIFCCNSADRFHGISACDLLKQTEKSRRDTNIENETLR